MNRQGLLTRRALLRAGGTLAIGAAAFTRSAAAAGFPERNVRIIAPFAAGGPSDTLARLMSVKLGESLGGFFYVENRPGGGSNIGTSVAARATPRRRLYAAADLQRFRAQSGALQAGAV